MKEVSFLLSPLYLSESIIEKYNSIKQTQDVNFKPIKQYLGIKKEMRADIIWAKIMPSNKNKEQDSWDCRYIMIPEEYVPYVNIDEYDGSETCYIDYNKYCIDKITLIITDSTYTNDIKVDKIEELLNKIRENKKIEVDKLRKNKK